MVTRVNRQAKLSFVPTISITWQQEAIAMFSGIVAGTTLYVVGIKLVDILSTAMIGLSFPNWLMLFISILLLAAVFVGSWYTAGFVMTYISERRYRDPLNIAVRFKDALKAAILHKTESKVA